jgi:hypothetical protein
MKQFILFISLIMCMCFSVHSQVNGSFFTLQLGKQTCLFKYTAQGDSLKLLTLIDTTDRSVDIKFSPHDTVYATNPKTHKGETKIISYPAFNYHIETTMTYFDFLLLLKTKFELKNPQKKLHVYSFNIYYETQDTGGLIRVKYPQTIEGVISKLNCLANGGFILLSLKADDHNMVNIDTDDTWLALIHIRK